MEGGAARSLAVGRREMSPQLWCFSPVNGLLRLTQASGGRGTGTEQNKPLGRQLGQEARKERVFHPEEDWKTHWDCDKTATH